MCALIRFQTSLMLPPWLVSPADYMSSSARHFTRSSNHGPAVERHGTRRRVTLERVLKMFDVGDAAAAVAMGSRVHLVRSGYKAL